MTAATMTPPTIGRPRHMATPATATPRGVGADAEVVAVGQDLGDDERGEERRREHGDEAVEPRGSSRPPRATGPVALIAT